MNNICFLNYDMSESGGIERVVCNLANSLCEKYNVYLVSLVSPNNNVHYDINDKIIYKNFGHHDLRIRQLITTSFSELKNFLKENNIKILFVTGCFPVPIVLPVKFFTKTKIVFCDHGALMNQYDDKKVLFFRKLAVKFFDKVVTLTERNMNDYINVLGVDPKKITCIYNWFDPQILNFKKQYQSDSKRIVTVGRFTKEKGYDMLLDVAKMVFQRHPDWRWSIFGEGEDFEVFKKSISENKLEEKIIFEGVSKNLYARYNDYSIYVMTSYREGMPLVLIEAKALGLPIVSFDCVTGPAEIVCDNVDGFLIKPYDKVQMSNKICELIENPELRKSFSVKSDGSLEKFSKQKILNQWISLIENL